MTKIEKLVLTIILGFIPPVLLFIILWFGLYLLFPDNKLIPVSIIGLIAGLIIDFIFMKRWLSSCYQWPIWVLILIFSFYHIGMLGFFMGFPVFNSFLGILAGYYYGNRIIKNRNSNKTVKGNISLVSIISSAFMLLICLLSGAIAISDTYITSELKGMLGLNFEPTKGMVIGLILVGGAGLILFEFWITRFTLKRVLKRNFDNSTDM